MCSSRNYLLSDEDTDLLSAIETLESPESDDVMTSEEYIMDYYNNLIDGTDNKLARCRVAMSTDVNNIYFTPEGNRVSVLFVAPVPGSGTIGVERLELAIVEARAQHADICLLIFDRAPAKNSSRVLNATNIDFQRFHENELQYNLIESVFVSEHVLCTKDEAMEFYYTTGTTPLDAPILRSTEPVARYYGWKTGDLIKILRDYPSFDLPSNLQLSYRIVL